MSSVVVHCTRMSWLVVLKHMYICAQTYTHTHTHATYTYKYTHVHMRYSSLPVIYHNHMHTDTFQIHLWTHTHTHMLHIHISTHMCVCAIHSYLSFITTICTQIHFRYVYAHIQPHSQASPVLFFGLSSYTYYAEVEE